MNRTFTLYAYPTGAGHIGIPPCFSHVITGKVLDEQGNPCHGVTIMVKGTTTFNINSY